LQFISELTKKNVLTFSLVCSSPLVFHLSSYTKNVFMVPCEELLRKDEKFPCRGDMTLWTEYRDMRGIGYGPFTE